MLKRTGLSLSWPRLIGIAAGTFGVGVAVSTAAQFSAAHSMRAQTPLQLIASLCGSLFLVLAFPLYTGKDWARRALIAAAYCFVVALLVFLSPTVFRSPSSSALPVLSIVSGVSALVSFLTPPAFLLAVLHHPDIRRAFHAQNASNQAMQPTAGSPLKGEIGK